MALLIWQTELKHDPKTEVFARRLGVETYIAAKHLLLLYAWAADTVDRGMLIAHSRQEVADAALWTGSADAFMKALEISEWTTDEYLTLHHFDTMIEFREGGRLPLEEWRDIRVAVLKRDKFACHYCGRKMKRMEVDHIVPVSGGGSNEMSNLVAACYGCNRRKGAKSYRFYMSRIGFPIY